MTCPVIELYETFDADIPPKETLIVPLRLVPLMVTEVAPAVGPELGLTAVTVGGELVYVKWSAAVVEELNPMADTVISTMPAISAGAVAVIDVDETTLKVAGWLEPPK